MDSGKPFEKKMFKLFVAIAFLAIVYAHPVPPTGKKFWIYLESNVFPDEEVKAEMVASGISATAAQGVIDIAEKYKGELEAAKDDHEAADTLFQKIKADSDAYIATQSSADQTAYAAYVAKKRAEFESHAPAAQQASK